MIFYNQGTLGCRLLAVVTSLELLHKSEKEKRVIFPFRIESIKTLVFPAIDPVPLYPSKERRDIVTVNSTGTVLHLCST